MCVYVRVMAKVAVASAEVATSAKSYPMCVSACTFLLFSLSPFPAISCSLLFAFDVVSMSTSINIIVVVAVFRHC